MLVYTDHSALIHLLKGDDAHGKIARWQQKLSEFDMKYVHIPGSQKAIADGLSRMPARYFQTSSRTKNPAEGNGRKEVRETAERELQNQKKKKEEENTGIKREVQQHNKRKEEERSQEEGNEEEGEAGTMEALVVGYGGDEERGHTGVEGSKRRQEEVWDAWEDSEWYRELVRFLLRGDFAGRNLGVYERRRIRIWGRRFVLFDGRRQKGLFYMEKDGRLSLCILPDDVTPTLEAYHDCHGHFAGRLLIKFVLGKVYWPTRSKDCHYYASTCPDCQSMGPVRPSTGIKPVVHLQPFDMVGLDFIGQITPTSAQGNKFKIIMVDYFSRFLFARAVPAATGEAARGLLETTIETFGRPLAVYTDNGQHFLGDEFHGTLVRLGIKHFPAPKTHPSSVGLAE